jgi:hypothetical protein
MNPWFHIRTLSLASWAVVGLLGLVMVYLMLSRRTYSGFGLWAGAAWTAAAGYLLMGLRGLLPLLVSAGLGNLLLIAAGILVCRGLNRFTGDAPSNWLDFGPLVVLTGLLVYFCLDDQTNIRVMVLSLGCAYYFGRGAWQAWRNLPSVLGGRSLPLMISLSLMAILSVVRAGSAMVVEHRIDNYMTAGPIQGLAFLLYLLMVVLVVLSLVNLNQQRVELELDKVHGELNVLKGILPVCSNCKKIKDENDQWHSLEGYVRRHSDAQVSHGLCPDCLQKLYPEEAARILARTAKESE